MAPKKKEVQKLSLGDFLNTNDSFGGGGSWADEVEDTYASGTQPLPPVERRTGYSSYGSHEARGYSSIRDNLPQKLPDKPPFTAHLGNLSYDATVDTVTEFFEGCDLVSVRIIEDREQQRPKGFAYAEFGNLEGLKSALTLDGQSFQGRSIRIKVADPPKERFDRGGGGDSNRDLSDWTRKGPLADLPRSNNDRRGSEFGERRPPREPQADDGKVRDFGNWERRGPLSPLPQTERAPRDSSRPETNDGGRSESVRGNRRGSPAAWGPGEGPKEGSRPPRREFAERPERPERVATAADRDMRWRDNMRPDAGKMSPGQSREGSEAPPSPAGPPAQPAGRPRLNLAKRTVSDAPDVTSPGLTGDSKASPFGAARPINTAAREREIEEKRVQAIKEKKEADEKAKEDRRIAKEAAAKEAAELAAAEEAAKASEEAAEEKQEPADEAETAPEEGDASANGSSAEQKVPIRSKEPREPRENVPNYKSSRANDSGNWRQPSGEGRGGSRGIPSGPRRGGPPRGPRGEGRPTRSNGNGPASVHQAQGNADQSPSTPTQDDDGWTTVPNKTRRGGRPMAA